MSMPHYQGEELKAILPHREPMLLLDEVWCEETADGREAHGLLTIGGDEFFLQGHFPDNPVVPGVITCEMLAQTCCVLLAGEEWKAGYTPFFTGLDKVKFRRPVRVGETLHSTVHLTRCRPPFYQAAGCSVVDGELCLEAHLSFALVETDA